MSRRKQRLSMLIALFISATPVNFAFAANNDKSNESVLNYLEGEDYIFTAERIPTNRWDTPANVHVITAEEIERNHYQTIAEALNHVNGVFVNNVGSDITQIIMNGSTHILVLIDGHRANNVQHGQSTAEKADFNFLPSIKMVERVEIVKGGSSALYGSDAAHGVINIITKKGNRNESTIDINTGSWSAHNYILTNQGSAKKFSWFVTGALNRRDIYGFKGEALHESDNANDYNDNSFSLRLDQRFSDKDSVTAMLMHKGHAYYDKMFGRTFNSFYIQYNFKEGTNVPGWFRYYNNYESKNTRYNIINDYSKLQGLEYQNGWELGPHKIIAGVEWHHDGAYSDYGLYDNEEDKTYKMDNYDDSLVNTAIYLQDTIKIGKKWIVIPGVRFDHSSDFGSHWSPKLALNYRPDNKTKFYGSWGRIYNTPTIFQIYNIRNDFYGNAVVYGRNRLNIESGYAQTLGVERNLNEKTTVSMNYFYSTLSDTVEWRNFPDIGARVAMNYSKKEHQHGMELALNQRLTDNFSYRLGYSHVSDATSGNYRPNGYILGMFYKNRGLNASLLSFMASGLDTKYNAAVSNYAVFDFNLSYDINEAINVYAKASNFTNQNYHLISKEYHSPGRSFLFGASYRF